MPGTRNIGREVRALWATLAAILLVAAGTAYGVTRYTQSELEADATRDARKLAVEALQPLLIPTDAKALVQGARYDQLVGAVREKVLAGPINGVMLWKADGTILFATDERLVGHKDATMRDDIHSVIGGGAQSVVDGARYRTLTVLRIGQPPTLVAAELDRSHAAIVEKSRERWYPWVSRAITAAVVCVVLYIGTAILFAAVGVIGRRAKSPRAAERDARTPKPGRTGRTERPVKDEDLPPYMQPGFQEEVEARRRAEEELKAVRHERDQLLERLRRLEEEPQQERSGVTSSA